MAQDWDIKPRADACGTCQTAFVDLQPYYSCLVFGTEGYARQDFCEGCWGKPHDGPASRYSEWRGIFRSPPPPAEEALKKETAETLLRKLIEDQDPARQSVIFILAVMLERKKLLIERDVQIQDGTTTRVYEHKISGETFVIHDPHLNLNELQHVQQEVAELLGGTKKAPAETIPADGAVTTVAAAAAGVMAAATAGTAEEIPEGDPADDAETAPASEETADEEDDAEEEEEEYDDEDEDEDEDEEEDEEENN